MVVVGTMAGRVLGLLREMLLAAKFGVSTEANIAVALLIIPDFISGALIGNAVNATLIPEFSKCDQPKMARLLTQALLVGLAFFALLALFIMFFGHQFVALLLTQNNPSEWQYDAFLLVIAVLPLQSAIAIIVSYLQYRGRFLTPAFANVFLNIIIISALVLVPGGLMALAIGASLAVVFRLLIHMVDFYMSGARLSFAVRPWELHLPLLKSYIITAVSCVLLSLVQYAPYGIIASSGGSVSLFNYAFKLILLPCVLGQTIVQMVLLPWFVKLSTDHPETLKSTYATTLQIGWIFSLAVCFALMLGSHQITELCFGYGKMTDTNITQVGNLFALGVWTMPGMIISTLWQQMLYANKHTHAPFYATIIQAGVVLPLGYLGYHVMGEGGVLLAYVFIQWIMVIIPAVQGRKVEIISSFVPSSAYLSTTLVMCLLFIPMAWLYQGFAVNFSPVADVLYDLVVGGLLLCAGLLACKPTKMAIAEIFDSIRRRTA